MSNINITKDEINAQFQFAKNAYAKLGVDVDNALNKIADIPVSVHCWQGDDVRGLESPDEALSGGIMATGNYPGVARNGDELRADMLKAFSLIPGKKRANIHAFYCETDVPVERDQLKPEHFSKWMEWSKENGIALDFNPTFFSHPKAADGFTLSNADEDIRAYWIQHGIACRKIAEAFAENQGEPCVINFWIPDGAKDIPADRWSPRARLKDSYDKIFDKTNGVDTSKCIDAVECKLFGIGSEEYVVGSHEFYLGYSMTNDVIPCFDMGHFHPAETIHDKISSALQFKNNLLMHVSRPIRWDSDHVVIFNDDLKNVFLELKRGNAFDKAYIALDFFDASINRIGAWTIGTRAAMKGILYSLLDPTEILKQLEAKGDGAGKLALMEEMKTMPFGAIWDYYCVQANVPVGTEWIDEMYAYEKDVLSKRA